MKKILYLVLSTALIYSCSNPSSEYPSEETKESVDKYQWLEEVESEKSLTWVKEKNKTTEDILKTEPMFESLFTRNKEIRNSKDRIASPTIAGKFVYNLWKDENNKRGLWRRMLAKDYVQNKTNWETVLDLDKLSEKESKLWVYKGSSWLESDFSRCLLRLSNGGGDAVEIREFDAVKKEFIKDGFKLPEAKGSANYKDKNTLYIQTYFGEGSMTTSGYARIVKEWKRGTALDKAKKIFEGKTEDVGTWSSVIHDQNKSYGIISRAMTFYTSEFQLIEDGKLKKIEVPEDCEFDGLYNGQMVVSLKSDWKVNNETFKSGSVISFNFEKFLNGERKITKVIEPNERSSVSSISFTKDFMLVNLMENVQNKLYAYKFKNDKWESSKINTPDFGSIYISSTSDKSEDYFLTFTNFLTPSSLYHGKNSKLKMIKSKKGYFDSSKYEIKQKEAVSKDGTKVPYFVVHKKDLELNGAQPTLLYGYGGFEVSLRPYYSSTIGTNWLEKGGVYVLANIRGGGEFGPKWHQAALKENRQNAYDDFFAVSEDLIKQNITSSKNLGIMGGSNGGLLVGVAFTQRPDLYNAVVCAVPLLDMKRFSKLLAGASWMGEYGNPDKPEEWKFIQKFSPYHLLKKDNKYPEVLFTTSTKDDRVHPGHARKMAAKMEEFGHNFYYYETIEGGHGGATTNDQLAYKDAITYTYLHKKLNQQNM